MLDVAGVAHRNDVPGEVQRWQGPGPLVSNQGIEASYRKRYRALRLAHRSQTLYVAHMDKSLSLSESCP